MEDSAVEFIDNDGVMLAIERRGNGDRHILFVHGWISSRRMWYDVAARLDLERFRIHLLDLRGCGLSDRPRERLSFEDYASDVRAAAATVPGSLTLVGHSMGGRLAQFVAADRVDNVTRMILIAPGTARAFTITPNRRAMTAQAFGSRAGIERFQRAVMKRSLERHVMRRLVDDALMCDYLHWTGAEHWARVDFWERLGRIAVPTLAIAGANDPLASASRVKRDVTSAIPGSIFVLLKDAGHNLPVEVPHDIAMAIERFR